MAVLNASREFPLKFKAEQEVEEGGSHCSFLFEYYYKQWDVASDHDSWGDGNVVIRE